MSHYVLSDETLVSVPVETKSHGESPAPDPGGTFKTLVQDPAVHAEPLETHLDSIFLVIHQAYKLAANLDPRIALGDEVINHLEQLDDSLADRWTSVLLRYSILSVSDSFRRQDK